MFIRSLSAAAVAAVVLAPALSTVIALAPPVSSGEDAATFGTKARPRDGYDFVPDPLLRAREGGERDRAYDHVLRRLLDAQSNLSAARVRLVIAQRVLDARELAVATLQTRLDRYEANDHDARESDALRALLREAVRLRDAAREDTEAARRAERFASAGVVTRIAPTIEARREWEATIIPRPGSWGALVQRATLLVRFRADVTDLQVAEILGTHRLEVQSEIPAISFYTVTSLDEPQSTFEAETTRLRALIESLEKSPLVESASQNTLLAADFLPRRNSPTARKWFDPRDVLTFHRHVQAWNLLAAMKETPVVGVLDLGFDNNSDIPLTPASELKPIPPCANVKALHGLLVAGVIGAAFDNGKGTDGAAPRAKIVACSPPEPTPCTDPMTPPLARSLCDRRLAMSGFMNGLATLLGQGVPIVNASVGYNWRSVLGSYNPADVTDVRTLVSKQGSDVRALMTAYPQAILVSSAGNDSTKSAARDAVWASPFNWAALFPGKRSENVIVAEAIYRSGKRLDDSNTNASIKALGRNVVAMIDPRTKDELFCAGTSGAAPLVTSTIAILRSIDPSLSLSAITKCLRIGTHTTPTLDAFAAASRCISKIETILSDLDGDGDLDDDDFTRFEKIYDDVRNGRIEDRNGDNKHDADDAKFLREELSGDAKFDAADLEVMIRARQLSSEEAAELRRRLEEQ